MTLKIYIKKFKKFEDIKKKLEKKYSKKEYEITTILTKRGKYKIKGDELILFKLVSKNSKEIEYKKKLFLISEYFWEKKEKEYNIPFNHHILKRNIVEYSIVENLKVIFEMINNKIIDFYFKTNEFILFSENLPSLLSMLK